MTWLVSTWVYKRYLLHPDGQASQDFSSTPPFLEWRCRGIGSTEPRTETPRQVQFWVPRSRLANHNHDLPGRFISESGGARKLDLNREPPSPGRQQKAHVKAVLVLGHPELNLP